MRNYYIFTSGILKRKDNTIFIENKEGKKPIPIEDIDQIFVFGEVDFNTKFLNFIAQNKICIHIFNYYGYYSGTFYPRETNVSGFITINQAKHYLDNEKRLKLASLFIKGAIHNIKRNLEKREGIEKEIDLIENYQKSVDKVDKISELMAIEGNVRKIYYKCFEKITNWEFERRTIQPPKNPLNALISFGNSLVYSVVLKEIYHTPLNPSISFLHEPSERRFSLSLDISEIFKPIISDKLILRLINNKVITEKHFEKSLEGIYLNEEGKKIFVKEFDEQLENTILHRKLKKKVKYKTLIRLELYKLIKHLLEEEEYSPLKVWW